MKEIIKPFGKISKNKQIFLILGWVVFLFLIWILGTMGDKHLFPNPQQVFKGFSELFHEGLVIHIFNSLKLCFL